MAGEEPAKGVPVVGLPVVGARFTPASVSNCKECVLKATPAARMGCRTIRFAAAFLLVTLACASPLRADSPPSQASSAAALDSSPLPDAAFEEPLSDIRFPTQDLALASAPPPAAYTAANSEHWHKIAVKYDISKIGNRGIGSGLNLYSLDREQQMGKHLADQVDRQTRLVNDPVVVEYVNRVAQNLVRNSDAKVPFTVKVIDNDEINAFALPGGYFYVNTGLILAADNEAQLAGAMAHEIAHVAARHATRAVSRTELANIFTVPLIFAGGPAGFVVRQAAGVGGPLSSMKFSRDAEREADLLGIEYEYAAGYDPSEFVNFFEKIRSLANPKLSFAAKLFMTHPMTDQRIQLAQEEIANLLPPRDQYVVSTSEFVAVKARLYSVLERGVVDASGDGKPVLRNRTNRQQQEDGPAGGGPTLRKHPSSQPSDSGSD
jgi:beta-barrel assembly-enhancing protease